MLDRYAIQPTRAHNVDAGLDLYTPKDICVTAGHSAVIDTGVHIEIPCGFVGFLKSKSGLNVKYGITSEGVIDSGYTGSIVVKLYNNGRDNVSLSAGSKITQLVILPCVLDGVQIVDSFQKTERGDNGFGSTGV